MVRIRDEIPQFKSCCMSLPLRHGLIMWGYIRLICGVFVFVQLAESFFQLIELFNNKPGYKLHVFLFGVFVIVGGIDIVLNAVLVHAGLKKNQQLLKAYYIYSFILWIFITILTVSLSAYSNIYMVSLYPIRLQDLWFILGDVFNIVGLTVIQAYVILLVKSVHMKPSRDCEFKFVNNAAESVCNMNYDNITYEDIIVEETITAERDIISNTNARADGNITASINVVANEVEGVYENETSDSIGTTTTRHKS